MAQVLTEGEAFSRSRILDRAMREQCARAEHVRAGRNKARDCCWSELWLLVFAVLLPVSPAYGQSQPPDWQTQVRKYAEMQDWESAMRLVDEQIALAPTDLELRSWRPRVLTWSGHLAEAEQEYHEILRQSNTDPDLWMGLASAYLRDGKISQAQYAIDKAEELDPKRADVHAARARVLRAAGERRLAQLEFRNALILDPSSAEARAGLTSVRPEAKHELRFGQDSDLFNFASANHDEWMSLESHWTSEWATSVSTNLYQRGGVEVGKVAGAVTRRQPKWGAVRAGGAIGHDHGLIPKSEALFDLDHVCKTSETRLVRAIEFVYGQHWYWYQSSQILTLNGGAVGYLRNEWMLSLMVTGARSSFSGTGHDWRPSGLTRVAFPLARWGEKRLSGNVFFATGTENFAQVDQIGSFASQTYGGGLGYLITARQDVTGYAGYQKRTHDRTDTTVGLSYGIHF